MVSWEPLTTRFRTAETMPDDSRILQDRVSVRQLQDDYPHLLAELRGQKQGKTLHKETVHFCGLACTSTNESYVFIPRKAQQKSNLANKLIARTTMKVLAKYGQETRDRTGVASAENGNVDLISTIQDLADDFRSYGVFAERVRYATKNSGKSNWARTAAHELAMTSGNGNIVYPNIRTSRSLNAHDSILAGIQVAVLLEIAEYHGWWLEGLQGREVELKAYPTPNLPRILWPLKLRAMLPSLFARRAIGLAKSLIIYLERNSRQSEGITLYGVEDFHVVWERMLREVLPGVEPKWNSILPKPAFTHAKSGHLFVAKRGMQTDFVIRDGKALKVLDAKYYDATAMSNSPGWPDIVKQLFYHIALASITDDEVGTGSFIFPSSNDGEGPFSQISIVDGNRNEADCFPTIDCIYMGIAGVMEAYVSGCKVKFPK